MTNTRSQILPFVEQDEEERRFHMMLGATANVGECASVPQAVTLMVAEIGRLVALVEQLRDRVETLEAELVPLHRSRKCPCCFRLSLAVVAARRHPELGYEGIEQHEVRCSCGYQASDCTTLATSSANPSVGGFVLSKSALVRSHSR